MRSPLFNNDDELLAAYTKGVRDGVTEEATRRTEREIAERVIRNGKMSLKELAECVPELSMEELKELETTVGHLQKSGK